MRKSLTRALATVAVAAAMVAAILPGATAGAATPSVTVTVDRGTPLRVAHLSTGTTLTQYTLNAGGDAAALASGRSLLAQSGRYQVQTTYQNGTMNPEPAPGVYNWKSLDTRVKQITASGAIPVLDLFGAPDWMKGGVAYQTDWSLTDVAPLPAHFGDFAALARQIALRYPQVKNYIVWSENKGFWNKSLANYDYVAYTNMYNQVFDALKSVSPTIKVGGPYMVLEGTGSLADSSQYTAQPLIARNVTFLRYWLRNKHGADFLAVDRKVAQRADANPYTNDELMALTPWFETVTNKLKTMTTLPIWFAESYFRCQAGNEGFMAAGLASMLYHQALGGAVVSLRWSPERQPAMGTCPYLADNLQNLFTSTQVAGGGQALPAFYVYRDFNKNFPTGTQLYTTVSSDPMVEVMANATQTMLINKHATPVDVTLNGTLVQLNGYEVQLI